MILPSFIIISVLATLLVRFRDVPEVQRAFAGVRAGVTALIFIAALKLGKKVIQGIFPIVVALAAFLALVVLICMPSPLLHRPALPVCCTITSCARSCRWHSILIYFGPFSK